MNRVTWEDLRRPIMTFIRKLIRDGAGATAIEYGLIVH